MPKETKTKKAESPANQYAIVEASGQQFLMQPNRYYDLDRINLEVDQTLKINNVLLINEGSKTLIGKPYIKGASVELKVLAHRRGPKILVYKMRPKKKTRRKNGHRQELTRVFVNSISTSDKSSAGSKVASSKDASTSKKASASKKADT